ncbi:hypothetical protein KP509_36G006800 [Ceratopteris richardii]|uniref:Uncharacterized protein n=1 Tax=Ceratopteris richardii TaxID=49495 RepID=A0A8T2QAU0_CERRI|nr:hypothetical protein KP509_36G006800 [Ceratopteris richardii]
MMVTDEEIVMRIIQVLQNADLTTTTTATIRKQLEEDLGIDLTDRKAFIREQVDLYLQAQHEHQQQQNHHIYLQQQQQYFHNFQQQQQHHHPHHPHPHPHPHPHHQHQPAYLQPHYYAPNFVPPHVVEEEIEVDEDTSVQLDPEPKRPPRKADRGKKDAQPKEKKKRTGGGLNKACGVSPELRALIGDKELTRTQVVKELWVYIRENNLQDPDNRRKIVCNDELRSLLGCDSTDMFKMNKLLARHIFTLENTGAVDGQEPKPKRSKPEKKDGSENDEGKRVSGFTAPHPISEALMSFLGTGESELSRSEVTKRIWEYIKMNQLQDPADKRRIICDNKLQELFGCDSFHGFGMAKYLSSHFIKG